MSTNSLETKMMKLLMESKIAKHVMMNDVLDDFSSEVLIKFLSSACKIREDVEGVIVETDEGDMLCPNFSVDVSANGEWLSKYIPACPFDIEQGGNIRKADEAEAAYECAVIVLVLKDPVFSEELNKVIKKYNFSEMESVGDNLNFKQLLDSWLLLNSIVINVTVSAAKYKISDLKKDTEKFLRSGTPQDAVLELRELATSVKNLNRDYSNGVLSPINIHKLTKIEILQFLEEKNKKINSIIEASNVSILYRLENLSSEYLSPVIKIENPGLLATY